MMGSAAKRDVVAGVAVLALSVFLFWRAGDMPRNPLVPIGPDFYPRILLGVTALLAAGVAASAFLARSPPAASVSAKPNYRLVALSFATFFVYILLLPGLGYRIATLLFVVALQVVIEPPSGARRWVTVGIVALVTTALTYVVFERYLSVLLPRGAWTGF
jgi:putative tricarboxylic transport membrane protein